MMAALADPTVVSYRQLLRNAAPVATRNEVLVGW